MAPELWTHCLALALHLFTDTDCSALRLVCKAFAGMPFVKHACLRRWPRMEWPLLASFLPAMPSIESGWMVVWRILTECEDIWRRELVEDILATRSYFTDDWQERGAVGVALKAAMASHPLPDELTETLGALTTCHRPSVKLLHSALAPVG
eukprot:NODE_4891_length_726_cov_45.005008_g4728_i0.p1 GENE.NODE_4891_length_726_cov_45.005008_g4728_i0~~NODE_4891_length_726_cov_45.005008_g4728_i0.p1  ORF type:complete len:167 (-),score=48.82 NODE_4891_length_726_cov_45.005008_g4728_i0:224-676(-)